MELTRDYSIYIHINKANGKVYIGQTCQKPEIRWRNGEGYKQSPRFYAAIKHYGWNNFDHKILYSNITREEANQYESELIKKYKSNKEEFGYNMTSGGEDHYRFTDEVKQKLREQKLGESNPQWGISKTEEQKKHLSEVQKQLTIEGKQHAKMVKCIDTGKVYYSCKDAARNTGTGNEKQCTHIADVCNGKRNKCNGYKWEWYNGTYESSE